MKKIEELSKEDLEAIVRRLRELMYLDMEYVIHEETDYEFWNSDKEMNGADLTDEVGQLLHQHGLEPEKGFFDTPDPCACTGCLALVSRNDVKVKLEFLNETLQKGDKIGPCPHCGEEVVFLEEG